MSNIEQVVLRNILTNEPYMRKVLPFIKPEYFQGVYNLLFKTSGEYVGKYNSLPTEDSLKVEIEDSDKYNDDMYLSLIHI